MVQNHNDYVPAAGRDAFLPMYDLVARLAGAGRIYRRLVEQAELVAGQKVLEVGCGTGNVAAAAVKAAPGIEMIAVDPDHLALRRARRKVGPVEFREEYAQRLSAADGTFDRALSSLMLHHIGDDEKPRVLSELYRVVKPGGSVHVVDIIEHRHRSSFHWMPQARPSGDLLGQLEDAGFGAPRSHGVKRTPLGIVEFFSAER